MEINDIKKKINILEKASENPELIMSDEFSDNFKNNITFLNMEINGKKIIKYFIEFLKKNEIFKDVEIISSGINEIEFYIKLVRYYSFDDSSFKDCLLTLNICKKTYEIYNDDINNYQNKMNDKCVLECDDLTFYKTFGDITPFTLRKRLKYAFIPFKDKPTSFITVINRIKNMFYVLFTSKKNLLNSYNKLLKEEERDYENRKEEYERQMKIHQHYLKNAPKQIELIRKKQNDIVNFLKKYNYKETKRPEYSWK